MKTKLLYMGLAIVLGLSTVSCTNDFESTNTDPNYMNVGDLHNPYEMFEPMFYGMARSCWTYYSWFWNDELAQYTVFSGGTTREENRYKIGESNFTSVWNNYCNYGNNCQHMIDMAVKYDVPAAQAVGMTLKVLIMSNLTDIYGDIPYKEAFKARSEQAITKPTFESQKEVYQDMLADLDSANNIYAAYIKKNASSSDADFAPLDLMYNGDMAKWQKFNNTLRMRLLCRVSGRSEMNAGEQVQHMLDNPSQYPVFTSNSDNAVVNLTGDDPFQSYFHNMLKNDFTSSSYHAAEQVIKLMVYVDSVGIQSYFDPRLPIWFVEGSNGWAGAISGGTPAERSESNGDAAQLNYEVFVRDAAPINIMDYAEEQFILAEMSLKGEITGGEQAARQYYENGVRASMQKWAPWGAFSATPRAITDEDIDTYLASPLGSWDHYANKEQAIGEQKYLALFWTGMEAYHEIRRTGYPELTLGNGTDYNDYQYPQRFAYNNTTVANNADQVKAALARMGGDNTMKTPVWWSKQAITGKLLFTYSAH